MRACRDALRISIFMWRTTDSIVAQVRGMSSWLRKKRPPLQDYFHSPGVGVISFTPGAPLLVFEKWPAENRNRAFWRLHRGPPFGYPPRLRSGLRQNRAGFL